MRYELKFNLPYSDVPHLTQWLSCHKGLQKSFPNRMVLSIYFDTLALDCAYDNLCGISNRKKYRIRWYKQNGTFYGARYELKIKNASLGTKEILPASISSGAFLEMTSHEVMKSIKHENIEKLWECYPLLWPTLFVEYEREYYESFHGIRLTIDTNLQFREMASDSHLNSYKVESYSGVIVELKFDPQYRDLIAEMLQDFPFYPVRTSKYVLGLSYFNRVNYI